MSKVRDVKKNNAVSIIYKYYTYAQKSARKKEKNVLLLISQQYVENTCLKRQDKSLDIAKSEKEKGLSFGW